MTASAMPYEVYASYDELPLDEVVGTDVGDIDPSAVILKPTMEELLEVTQPLADATMLAGAQHRRPVVAPLRRNIKVNAKGPDVVGMARALSKWEHRHGLGAYREHPTNLYAAGKRDRVKRFQHHRGIKASGVYNEETHHKLLPFIDGWGAHLFAEYHPQSKAQLGASACVAQAAFAYHHAPRHYNNTVQTLRCQGWYQRIAPPNMWWYEDCSGYALHCMWVAAGKPRTDSGLAGWWGGWTGSMLEHGKTVSVRNAKPGAMVFYNNHVAIYGGNEKVFTHGHEGGPYWTSMYYRTDVQRIVEYYGRG